MKSDIGSLFPAIYKGVRETDILTEVENTQFDEYFGHMDAARCNQFVVTADIHGIESFERIYNIRANPDTEDIEFRRQRILLRMQTKPPFTIRYLRQRLDELIGAGKYRVWMDMGAYNYKLGSWRLGRKPFRDPTFTLNVEATTVDANWYHEVQVFIGMIKPANIVYAFTPLLAAEIGIDHQPDKYKMELQTQQRLETGREALCQHGRTGGDKDGEPKQPAI